MELQLIDKTLSAAGSVLARRGTHHYLQDNPWHYTSMVANHTYLDTMRQELMDIDKYKESGQLADDFFERAHKFKECDDILEVQHRIMILKTRASCKLVK